MLFCLALFGGHRKEGTVLLFNLLAAALGTDSFGLVMLSHGHGELEFLFAFLAPVSVDRHSLVLSFLRAEQHLRF